MAAATEAVTSASPSSLFNGFISTLNTACFLSARLIVRSERWTDKIFIKVFSNHNWVFNVFKESFRKLYLLFISWIDRTTLELAWSSDLQQTWMHQKWMNTCVIFDVLCVCMLHFFLHRGNHLIKNLLLWIIFKPLCGIAPPNDHATSPNV